MSKMSLVYVRVRLTLGRYMDIVRHIYSEVMF